MAVAEVLVYDRALSDSERQQVEDYLQQKYFRSDDTTGPIGDFQNAPTDPDGDGHYEDVNGDGNVNVGDAQALFANTDDPVVQDNADAFDYNDDGSVNVGDAQALFANGVDAGDA
jgi:hypothetical protein